MLKSMRIGRKLLLSFICLLVLTMIVGRVGKSGMDKVSNNMDQVQSVNDILTLFNQARLHEKDFALLPETQKAANLRNNLQQLQNQTQQLQKTLNGSAAAAKVEEAAKDARAYLGAFDNYAQISVQRQQSMEEMKTSSNAAFKAIKSLQNTLNDILDTTITSRDEFEDADEYEDSLSYVMEQLGYTQTINLLFLNARKFEKEHIISNNKKFMERARKSIKNMLALTQELEDSFDDDENVAMALNAKQKIVSYSSSFENHANQMDQQQQLSQTMQQTADNAKRAGLAALAAIKNNSQASMSSADRTLIIISILAIVLGLLLAFRIARGISVPLSKTVEMLDSLENGHLDTRLQLDRGDEIGHLAATMDRFADSLQQEIVKPLNDLASGNLNFDIHPHDQQDQLRTALKKLGDDMNGIMMEVQVAGEQIDSGSSQVSDSSQSLSQGATQQASSLEEISSSLHEISDQTRQNADSASDASKLTKQVQQDAEQGSQQMGLLNTAMSDINEASQSISKIIKVIDEIAFQTNLLALNAAVEAARAGQHGKGFAVVAEEVRNLAARSAKAAHETTELIEGSVAKAQTGSDIAQKTAESLSKIVSGVTSATDLASEIAHASTEQAQGLAQITLGVSQIDDVTQQNTACAEETAAAAEELRSQADCLQQLLQRFTLRHGDANLQQSFAAPTPQPARKPQPALTSSQPSAAAPQPQSASNDNWGAIANNEEIQIDLDDSEFGKF